MHAFFRRIGRKLFSFTLLGLSPLLLASSTHSWDEGPFGVGLHTPRLITPQWVGEPGVEAVIILSIDDLRSPEKYETYLRPILERLKEIDGRAPVSIFCNAVDPAHPQFQAWIDEGLSLEVHTLSHPCPLLAKGDFQAAQETYYGGIDLINQIPNQQAVAYRMPCCDSINSPSPRFYEEIFTRPSPAGSILQIDSSIMCVLNSTDPDLPRQWVLDAEGKERFEKYLPFPSFTTTIENYPYPYRLGPRGWEFPAMVPSDWEAQNLHGVNHHQTTEDWKRALDLVVHKQGVFNWIFHPHGWIGSEHIVDFIDYAQENYGGRIRFMTFHEALARLETHLLDDALQEGLSGPERAFKLLDVNEDGFMDVCLTHEDKLVVKQWLPAEQRFDRLECPWQLASPQHEGLGLKLGRFWPGGAPVFFYRHAQGEGAWSLQDGRWQVEANFVRELRIDGHAVMTSYQGAEETMKVMDLNGDGVDELLVAYPGMQGVLSWDQERKTWKDSGYQWPRELYWIDDEGRDHGARLVDLNADGYPDLVQSNPAGYQAYLFIPKWVLGFQKGWTRDVMKGLPGDADAMPLIVREGAHPDNGAWFANVHLWVQNEDTDHLPYLVQRQSFETILLGHQPRPKSVEEAAMLFELPEGLQMDCVAAEPLIEDPVAFDWAPNGDMWVVEMRDYPGGMDSTHTPGGRIKRLQDLNGDGQYDQATLFLDEIPFPSGIHPWENGWWISAAPFVFFAADLDGDGKADVRRNLLSGFGEGNQQHRVNGFAYGLDHTLHGANGDSGGLIQSLWHDQSWPLRRRDFAFSPVTGRVQLLQGQTQYGRNRDDWGRWFGNNNPNWLWHFRRPFRYDRAVPEMDLGSPLRYLAQDESLRRVNQISPSLQRFNDIGMRGYVTSACSPTPYRDQKLFQDGGQHVLVSEPVHNLVRHFQLEMTEGGLMAKRPELEQSMEFLASRDPWFRPTSLRTGPDGALYVADMYRAVIEHTEWIPDDVEKLMDPRLGSDRGRIWRLSHPEGPSLAQSLWASSGYDWGSWLASENGWKRDTAQRKLIEQQDHSQVELLVSRIAEGGLPALHALWTLEHLQVLEPSHILKALKHGSPDLRCQAWILLERHPTWLPVEPEGDWGRLLTQSFQEESSEVIRQLLFFAGTTQRHWLEPIAVSALHRLGKEEGLHDALLVAAMPYLQGVLSHQLTCNGCLASQLPSKLLPAIASRLKDGIPSVLQGLETMLLKQPSNDEATQWSSQAIQGTRLWLQAFSMLDGVGQAKHRPFIKSMENMWRATLLDPQGDLQGASLSFDALWTTRRLDDSTQWMMSLTQGLKPDRWSLMDHVLQRMVMSPQWVQDPEKWVGLLWSRASHESRRLLVELMLTQQNWSQWFLEAVEKGRFPEGDLPFADGSLSGEMMLKLRAGGMKDNQERVERAFAARSKRLGQEGFAGADLTERMERVAALSPDIGVGADLFANNCRLCHAFHGNGAQVGPDLDALSDRSGLNLITQILNPSQSVEEAYIAHDILLKDGSEWLGIITDQTPSRLTLRLSNGQEKTLDPSEVDHVSPASRSLMPDGWGEVLDDQQLASLIAYLQAGAGR